MQPPILHSLLSLKRETQEANPAHWLIEASSQLPTNPRNLKRYQDWISLKPRA